MEVGIYTLHLKGLAQPPLKIIMLTKVCKKGEIMGPNFSKKTNKKTKNKSRSIHLWRGSPAQ